MQIRYVMQPVRWFAKHKAWEYRRFYP